MVIVGVKTKTTKDEFPEIRKTLKTFDDVSIQCGVFGEQAWLAAIHEYGCKIPVTPEMRAYLHRKGLHLKATTKYITIPERSFLRNGYDENKDEILAKTGKLIPSVLDGTLSSTKFYKTTGLLLKSAIQDYAVALDNPKNHPFTVSQKKSANPLVDSGDMIGAVDYEVIK